MPEIKFSCPHCQQHIQGDSAYGGMQIQCPNCQGSFVVPQVAAPSAPAAAPATAASASTTPARLSIRGGASAPSAPPAAPEPAAPSSAPAGVVGGACPSCSGPMPRGAVICRNCGYNTTTGQRMVAGRSVALGRPTDPDYSTPWYQTPWPYIGAVALLLGVFFLLGRQNPTMLLGFLGVGVLYVFVVHIMVLVTAFREGTGTGLLCLFIPCYAIYFVFKVSDSDTLKILYGFGILVNIAIRFLPVPDA